MKKHELQTIKEYLDALKPTGQVEDYHAALNWFWDSFPVPANRPDLNNRAFDRFCFQAFERLGLNKPCERQDAANRKIIATSQNKKARNETNSRTNIY